MEKEGEGEDAPADVPAYGRWVPLASQMSGGKGKGGRGRGCPVPAARGSCREWQVRQGHRCEVGTGCCSLHWV